MIVHGFPWIKVHRKNREQTFLFLSFLYVNTVQHIWFPD